MRLTATPDRALLRADDTDLSYLTIEFKDDRGTVATAKDHHVSVQVDGAVILQGFGSGRPDNAERYDSAQLISFDGRLLAIVRPTEVGEIVVTITAEGFEPVKLTLDAAAHETELVEDLHR